MDLQPKVTGKTPFRNKGENKQRKYPSLAEDGRNLACVAVSALLQVFSFPFAAQLPYWRELLAWFALVPWLLVLVSGRKTTRWLTGSGYLCGVLFYLGNCYWIYQTMYLYGGLPRLVALGVLLLFAAYLALYHGLFAWVVGTLAAQLGRRTALVVAPCVWVAVELARARVTGFPWDLLGYSQVSNLLVLRLAPLGGVMLLSFVLATGNSVVLLAWSKSRPWRGSLAGVGYCLLVGAIWYFGRPGPARQLSPNAWAILLQEDLRVGATARDDQPVSLRAELDRFTELTLRAAQDLPAGQHAALVAWPEAPSHLYSNDPTFQGAMSQLARRLGAPLVVGSLGVDRNPNSGKGYSLYDSAALFRQDGSLLGRYDKIHLVPWGEYVPYKEVFAFAQKLTEGVGDMDRGSVRTVFVEGGHRFGTFICYESIFGDEVRQFVGNGAEVLVNLSDDGWYGDTGAPWQHLNMARMRAVENGRWLVRDTNTGETTVIDPEGRYAATTRHVRTAYALPFGFRQTLTFYTRHGDWVAWLCVAVGGMALLLAGLRRRQRPAGGEG